MPKLPQISGRKLVKVFEKEGWVKIGQKGSHIKLVKNFTVGKSTIIVPNHKVIKKGTLSRILKDSGLSIDKI